MYISWKLCPREHCVLFLIYACQTVREHLNVKFEVSCCQGITSQCFRISKWQYLKTAQMDIAPFHGQRAICMNVCRYVCICKCVRVYVYVRVYACMYMYVCRCVCICKCVGMYVYVSV